MAIDYRQTLHARPSPRASGRTVHWKEPVCPEQFINCVRKAMAVAAAGRSGKHNEPPHTYTCTRVTVCERTCPRPFFAPPAGVFFDGGSRDAALHSTFPRATYSVGQYSPKTVRVYALANPPGNPRKYLFPYIVVVSFIRVPLS